MLFICFFQVCLKFYDKIYERFLVCFYILYQSLQINMVRVIIFDFKGQYMHQVLQHTTFRNVMNLLWLIIAVMPQLKVQNTPITLQLNKERDEKLTTQFIQNRMA